MDRRTFLAGAAMAAGAGCLGGVAGSTTPTPEYDVGMRASAFVPEELQASVGETVVWRNTNSRAHTVTAYGDGIPDGADYFASGGFDSEAAAREAYANRLGGALATGDTFEYTVAVPGTYRYFCVPHEAAGMVGRIVVE